MSSDTPTYIMFEEIKDMLKKIVQKNDQQEKQEKQHHQPIIQVDTTRIESLIENIKPPETDNQPLWDKLEQIEQILKNPPKQTLYHMVLLDIKSSWVACTLISLFLLLIVAVSYIYKQHEKIDSLSDNDIKYRHIKAAQGIDSTKIHRIENIFTYNRDEKAVKDFRKNVEEYERKVIERVQKLEQAEFKELEAKQLKEEAEGL
ncbi:DUF2960 domain-containing protein [Dysgonomonas sp. HDW5B]|uniref:DUF2960 domain-containing protein n=1 Tax=Dysgonomonas sp. HDW5B TaxID=2714927 RepID=UPI00140A30B8|nr:DUF2960 domain-containing protein [Dysgonomonas sp. HDW5B]QIK53124.1 DUF2960 domain-containing protein [Dysgonomonas sp. HDW5B]